MRLIVKLKNWLIGGCFKQLVAGLQPISGILSILKSEFLTYPLTV